jgi:purine-cytosine permease-like protein
VLVPLVQYQNFLLLIGAVFVPLFGVLAAHYAIVRRGYSTDDIYGAMPAWRPWAAVAWFAGFAAYNWLNPGTVTWWVSAMKSIFGTPPSFMSASIVSFVVSFAIQGAEALVAR